MTQAISPTQLTTPGPEPISDPDRARTVCMSIQKGGTGKSTSTALIGHALARLGLRVLLVDFAPNASLTSAILGIDPATETGEDGQPLSTTADIITPPVAAGAAQQAIIAAPDPWQPDPSRSWADGGAAAPGGELWVIPGWPDLQFTADDTSKPGSVMRLAKALSGVASQFDICLIDTDPTAGQPTQLALFTSGYTFAPVLPEPNAIEGFASQLEFIQSFADGWGIPVTFLGALCVRRAASSTAQQPRVLDDLRGVLAEAATNGIVQQWTVPSPVGDTTGGVLFAEHIPNSMSVQATQSAHAPITATRDGRASDIARLYTLVGIRLLALTNPERASSLTDLVAQLPLAPDTEGEQ